ncbi:hypothetical protein [Burkholderia ubonensis]|uniref:hypothetical protein n=1 Tax=Burkholderia ubonensis TaxID=101571 RepID=UPI000A47238D|nr:hypothetical protein [Burkholderia ubonensis]
MPHDRAPSRASSAPYRNVPHHARAIDAAAPGQPPLPGARASRRRPIRQRAPHQFHAAVHQLGSIFAFLALFLSKEASEWMV